jgi:hypothetical protein
VIHYTGTRLAATNLVAGYGGASQAARGVHLVGGQDRVVDVDGPADLQPFGEHHRERQLVAGIARLDEAADPIADDISHHKPVAPQRPRLSPRPIRLIGPVPPPARAICGVTTQHTGQQL